MRDPNQHKPGYKHTSLGWIPENWNCAKIRAIANKEKGAIKIGPFGSQLKKEDFIEEGIKVYDQETAFSRDFLRGKNFITLNKYKQLKTCTINVGDVIISMMGTIGSAAIVPQDAPVGILNSHLLRIKPNSDIVTPDYLRLLISECPITRTQIKKKSHGGIMSGLSAEIVKSISIIIPPLPEQCKIASILSTWDEAITKTQQLIAQLQQRNKGLMQQLLTGKKRLKGFEGKWRKNHVYDIANEVSLKNKNGKDLTVMSCTKYNGLVPSLEYFGRRVFGSDTSTYKVVPLNHFAYATNHIEEGSIGYQNTLKDALISPMYTVFKTNDQVHDDYFFKLLKSHNYIHEYCKRMEGSIDRRGGLRWDDFSKIIVFLPGLNEQVAIASLLNKADEEVKLFNQKLATLQQQKKGLMQKLLTGEVRVKTVKN